MAVSRPCESAIDEQCNYAAPVSIGLESFSTRFDYATFVVQNRNK